LNVLFVDDEADYLETLMKRMRKRNINVTGLNSGKEAIAFLSQNPVDVVVLDVRMPEMDGIGTLTEIKKVDPLIEAIFLTGHACLEVAKEGMDLGAFDYLMKPVDIDELLHKIQDAYTKKKLVKKN
jgi:DNA-binding NtrC family response regulator